jgi:hypothetical protein
VKTTPLRQFTVVDVALATLGVGPCEFLLDVEGQGTGRKGLATCPTRTALNAIFAGNQQRQKKTEIERLLADVTVFVKFIRSRIEDYAAFGLEMLLYLDEQKKARPEIAEFLSEMETLTKAIGAGVAERQDNIKTPQYAVDLIDEFRRNLLEREHPNALAECERITESLVAIGGEQDELVGECRAAVKVLRQRAGMAMAANPAAAEVAKEIRNRTQKILRNAVSHEFADH